ncbi:hypothetical protein QVD99_006058 [Batrachochytrium dendrobatidis]|nr:hypothetical protein QVD99_006058 [Batrachochytrium dendrobatidis]
MKLLTLFHTDNQEILKLRIKEHLLALTDKSISNLKKLFYRRHIGQDLIDLRDTYDKSDDFYSFCKLEFSWDIAMLHLYSNYYTFVTNYPMFLYSGLNWTTLRNKNVVYKTWLESEEANELSQDDCTLPLFWIGKC